MSQFFSEWPSFVKPRETIVVYTWMALTCSFLPWLIWGFESAYDLDDSAGTTRLSLLLVIVHSFLNFIFFLLRVVTTSGFLRLYFPTLRWTSQSGAIDILIVIIVAMLRGGILWYCKTATAAPGDVEGAACVTSHVVQVIYFVLLAAVLVSDIAIVGAAGELMVTIEATAITETDISTIRLLDERNELVEAERKRAATEGEETEEEASPVVGMVAGELRQRNVAHRSLMKGDALVVVET